MSILAEIQKRQKNMNREIDYERFSRLRAVVADCGLETQEERESAFKSLVNCLVSKRVFQPDGSIVSCRNTCLSYFAQICSRLEPDELELMINKVEVFYQNKAYMFQIYETDTCFQYSYGGVSPYEFSFKRP